MSLIGNNKGEQLARAGGNPAGCGWSAVLG
jgi:hypothetical protein